MDYVNYVRSFLVDLSGVDEYTRCKIPVNIEHHVPHDMYDMSKVRMSEPPFSRQRTYAQECPWFLEVVNGAVQIPKNVHAFTSIEVFPFPGDVLKSATLYWGNNILKVVDLLGCSTKFAFFDLPFALFLHPVGQCTIKFEYYKREHCCPQNICVTAIVIDEYTCNQIINKFDQRLIKG